MSSAPQSLDEKTLFYHRYIEAFKFANGQKKHIRDPRIISDKVSTKFKLCESYIRLQIKVLKVLDRKDQSVLCKTYFEQLK